MLFFSFYVYDENEEIYSDTPAIGIMARDMSMVCCVEEINSVFRDDEEDCESIRIFTDKINDLMNGEASTDKTPAG